MELGSILKKLRKDKGLTLQDLADIFSNKFKAGTTKSIISLWENNKANPSFSSLKMYTDYFNISLDELKNKNKITNISNSFVSNTSEIDISHLTEEEKEELNTIINSNFIMYFNGKKDNTKEAKESLKRALTEAYLEVVELSKKKGE